MSYSNITHRLDQLGQGGEPAKIQIITQYPETGAWLPGDITPAPAGADWSGLLTIRVEYDDRPFTFLPQEAI